MTDTNDPNLVALRSIDWSSDREVSDIEWRRARAHMERLVGDHTYSKPVKRRVRARKPIVAVAGFAALIAVVAISIAVVAPGQQAFASWRAVPDRPSATQALKQAQACAATWLTDIPRHGLVASDVLLAETRGEATLSIVEKARKPVVCLQVSKGSPMLWGDLLGTNPSVVLESDHVTSNGFTSLADSGHAFSYSAGEVGPEVTGVEIVTEDGTDVSASIADGYWAAWWPGRVDDPETVKIVVHSSTGTVTYTSSQIQG